MGSASTQSGRIATNSRDSAREGGSAGSGEASDPFAGFHNTIATVTMARPLAPALAHSEDTFTITDTPTFARTYSHSRSFSRTHTHRSSLQPPPPPQRPSLVRIRWKQGHIEEEFPREIQDRLTRRQFAERVAELNGIGDMYRQQRRTARRLATALAVVAIMAIIGAICVGTQLGVTSTLVPLFIMIALFASASPYFAYRAICIDRGMIETVQERLVSFSTQDDVRGIKWQLFMDTEGDKKKEKQRYIEIDIIESTELQQPIVFELEEDEANEPQSDLPPSYEADASPPMYSELRAILLRAQEGVTHWT